MIKRCLSSIILLLCIHIYGGCSYFEDGQEQLMLNNPKEALVLFEMALAEEPSNKEIYLNLAFVHGMLGEPKKSIDILKTGLTYAGDLKFEFYYELGNYYYVLQRNEDAVRMFSKSIELNSQFPEPYLNRANGNLQLSKILDNMDEKVKAYEDMIKDYEKYLLLKPGTTKRRDVEKMIAILKRFIRDKEQKEKDLENLLDILNNTSDSTKDIKAGAEDIKVEYEDEDILD